MTQNSDFDEKLATTSASLARKEKILDKLRLPLTLAGMAAGAVLVVAAAPVLGLTLASTIVGSAALGLVSGITAFGFVDKYACRFGERNLAVSGMVALRHLGHVEDQFKQSLPLKDDAKKAFIKALTDGIRDKLHIRKPIQLKKPAVS